VDEAALYLRLSEKLLAEAEELLRRGDYIQASEKTWGAAVHVVKALAVKEGRKLESHSDLWRFMSTLATKLGDKGLDTYGEQLTRYIKTFTRVGCHLKKLLTALKMLRHLLRS